MVGGSPLSAYPNSLSDPRIWQLLAMRLDLMMYGAHIVEMESYEKKPLELVTGGWTAMSRDL
jgi:hypothetical protein